MKLKIRETKDNLIGKLNDMQNEDPKEYWSVIKQLEELHTEKQQPSENISPSTWVDHFKSLVYKDPNMGQLAQSDLKQKLLQHINH